jgi:hypothetical protein
MQETLQGADSSGISTQGASNSKPVQVEGLQLAAPAIRGHLLARPMLSGAAGWKLKKTRAGENGPGAQVLVPGY